MRRSRAILVSMTVVLLAGLVGPAHALANVAWWHLSTSMRPAVLAANGEGALVVQAINLGDAAAVGPMTLTDTLPAGVRVVEEEVEPGVFRPKIVLSAGSQGQSFPSFLCKVVSSTVSCTFPEGFAFLPYEYIQMRIVVRAGTSTEDSHAEVSGGGAAPVAVTQPVSVGGGAPVFGVEHFEQVPEADDGSVDVQAGSHPFALTTSLSLNQTANPIAPPALPRSLRFQLPPGLVGDTQAVPQCSELDFREITSRQNHCPEDTAIGAAVVNFDEPKLGELTWVVPLYNLVPAQGEPARFGITVAKTPVTIDTAVRTGADYGVTASVSSISEAINFLSETVSFWGVPNDPVHNESRGYPCLVGGAFNDIGEPASPPCNSVAQTAVAPFLTNPTSCRTGFVTSVEGESWPFRATPEAEPRSIALPRVEYSLKDAFGRQAGITGCNQLQFSPFIEVAPDAESASTSTGLKVDVKVPQEVNEDAGGLASSSVKEITVALPEGVQVNPSGANNLEACSEPEIGFQGLQEFEPETEHGNETVLFTPTLGSPFCPDASKIGTVEIHTPLIKNPLKGSVYLASQNENPFGSLIAAYIVAEDKETGVLVKLPGEVHLTSSGQLVSTFENNPQLPFEDAELHFFGGERAPLATPAFCREETPEHPGAYTTTARFVPWSAEAWDEAQQSKTATSMFKVSSGPNGSACPGAALPFSPSLTGGMTNSNAGSFGPLTTTIGREDGQQGLQSVTLHMPAGLEGLVAGVKLCPEAQANEGTCGTESLIGETTVSAGVGNDPVAVHGGKVYITEKYGGAPFGLSIVNPVKTGPFDLEHDTANPAQNPACDCLVVRAKIEVDPATAALTVTTDPSGPHAIPQMIDGVPVQIKKVNVTIDRERFTFNPTSCNPMSITGTITGAEGAANPVSVPFQVTNCGVLGFNPGFKVSVTGNTSKQNGAGLTAKLSYPTGSLGSMANIARAKVELPEQLPSRLTTLQKACLAKVFEANPASCPPESIVGHAKVITPVLPVPLEGPAYFVSHGGEAFPNLTIILRGYGVSVDLVGSTFISKRGITSTTFKATPDVPFNIFELTLPQGKFSALTANANLCQAKLAMPTEFTAQNGLTIHHSTPIEVTSCPTRIALVSHKLHGHNLTLTVYVPAAGRLKISGNGLTPASKNSKGRETLTLTVHLNRHDHFKTRLKLAFKPGKGKKQSKSVSIHG